MSVKDYVVESDKFEPDETLKMSFPCSGCKYQYGSDKRPPCSECGHNICAELNEQKERATHD